MKKIAMLVGIFGLVAVGCVTSSPSKNEAITGSWNLQKVTCSDKNQEARLNNEIQKQEFIVAYEFKNKQFNEKMTEKSQRVRRNISQVTNGTFESTEDGLVLVREKTELTEANKKTLVTWDAGDVMKIKKASKTLNGNTLVISTDDACAISSGSLHFVQL